MTPEELLRKFARAGRHTPGCTIIISWGDAGCDCGADDEMHDLCQEARGLVGDLQDAEHDFQRAVSRCDLCKQGAIPVRTMEPVTWDDHGETKSGEVERWIHSGYFYPDEEEPDPEERKKPRSCFLHQFHEERMKPKVEEAPNG